MRRMIRLAIVQLCITLAVLILVFLVWPERSASKNVAQRDDPTQITSTGSSAATVTFLPSTPLPTLTPSRTLLPAPTFAPPILTPLPTSIPSPIPSATLIVAIEAPAGIHGLETPTPSSTPGCLPRKEWTLTYNVQPNDALERIAAQYGTDRWELAEANCLSDPNFIVVGQELRVPGATHPQNTIECTLWQPLTPYNGAYLDNAAQLTFNWRGPRAPRNLIRVFRPDGSMFEAVVDLRQSETVNLTEHLPAAGTYSWYVFPLDWGFKQIECLEGGPWTFYKTESLP